MNPYDVLNVRDNASDMDIKKAYLTYKRKFDLNSYSGDHEYAKKRLAEIEKAFSILSNPQLRSAFDNRHNAHVKSHIVKKDMFKEYYQNDPIGTHYHRDYDLAMKKFNANKPLFDFTKNAIKTYDDDMFTDENIRDYSDFTSKKVSNALVKFIIFIIIIGMFMPFITFFISIFSSFENTREPEETYQDSFDKTLYSDYDTDSNYNSNQYTDFYDNSDIDNNKNDNPIYNYDYQYNTDTDTNSSSDYTIDVNDFYTDSELLEMYNTTYKNSFDSFTEFKNFLNNYLNKNN